MGRVKNIKNRSPISNEHVKSLIKHCLDKVQEMNYCIPSNLRFLQCKAARRAGLACYSDNTIVLSTFIYKESDAAIQTIIYHEIGHIIAGPGTHHGPAWQRIVNNISRATGLKITRCYSDTDMPIHAEEKKSLWKYNFRCKGCGGMLHYSKRTVFVQTYNQIMENGQPRWTCTKCHNSFELLK